MRIIRYQNSAGESGYAALGINDVAFVIEGDIYGDCLVSNQEADVQKILAPIVPLSLIHI